MGENSCVSSNIINFQLLRLPIVFIFIITTLSCFSYAQSKSLLQKNSSPKITSDPSKLPQPVRVMRASIIRAAKSGDIKAVRAVLQRNEIKPIVNFDTKLSPVEYWLSVSEDGNGKDIMANMVEIFLKPYAVINEGTSKEKYIWPYLAELNIKTLSPRQEVDILRLVSFKDYQEMKKSGRYLGYRASIGKDGTWHLFVKEE